MEANDFSPMNLDGYYAWVDAMKANRSPEKRERLRAQFNEVRDALL